MINKLLKYLRRGLAIVIGGLILLFFLDITSILPVETHALLHIQIVPAIMAGSLAIIAIIAILTLLFGRIYCSVICPLGIMQDVILRFKLWWLRITKKGKQIKTKYAKPLNITRYTILSILIIAFILGLTLPLNLLDPYSTFGRIATSLFRPVAALFNNLLAMVMNAAGNYSFYKVSIEYDSLLTTIFSAAVLIAIIIAVWRKERIVCNSVCPVGSLLGLVSRYSLFKITLNDKCTNCKLCASSCKSRCIDIDNKTVDKSRCVVCFNCLDKCKKGALSFSPNGWAAEVKEGAVKDKFALSASSLARRRFIKGSAVVFAAAVSSKLLAKANDENPYGETDEGSNSASQPKDDYYTPETFLPMPPGVGSKERFLNKCTACQLCITKCPTHTLQPAFLELGLTGIMMPVMKFKIEQFCNPECKICTEVCPNHAIQPISLEEKKLMRVGMVKFFKEHCVVYNEHQDCGACAEHCPTQAVHMVPFEGTLTIPEITPDLCIGCGGCQSICPVVPAAIRIDGIAEQVFATPPTVKQVEQVEINDFGF